MKKLIALAILLLVSLSAAEAQPQDKAAKKIAKKVSLAFAYGMRGLDKSQLLRGPLKLTIENSGGDVEFEHKTFRNFAAMERWLKSLVHEPGFPIRTSGDKPITCRKAVCRLDLVDNQMAHNRVFLTKIYYGYYRKRIYVKKLYIIFG